MEKRVKLDIGCGKNKQEGYIGVDINENSEADIIASASSLPFENESVDEIVCRHVIEHLSPEEAKKAFSEFFRVLKKGSSASLKIDRDWSKKRLLKKDPTHKYRYTADEIKKLANFFSRVKVENKIYRVGFRFYNKLTAELKKSES